MNFNRQATDFVLEQSQVSDFGSDENADSASRLSILDDVVLPERNSFDFRFQSDPNSVVLNAAIQNAVSFNQIMVSGKILVLLVAEQDAMPATVADLVVADDIVRVVMADRDTHMITSQHVVLGQAVPHSPAEEDADVVPFEAIVAHHRSL